ncbi:MAG TPA: anhydro-N-acetylmuramic acid kinase [Candidatus Sulfotelmatobacter sp.]
MSQREMIVAGVMSGTSADGIDVALVKISVAEARPGRGQRVGSRSRGQQSPRHTISLIGHSAFPYAPKIRAAVLSAMNAESMGVADLARLGFLLAELYSDAIHSAQRKFGAKTQLVGCHGQTLYHQGNPRPFLGRNIAATWQIGEAAVIASRVGVPVVSDFRPADMAAGGKGAPLVPYLDYMWFRDEKIGRIAQNIGGIANLTAIPAGTKVEKIFAFDTGPGNMVIDAVTHTLFGSRFDHGGKIAASGKVSDAVVKKILRREFFRAKPPKTAGREEFGREFVREFLRACGPARKQDVVATATALTARSIADSVRRFVVSKPGNFREIILSGGGAKNRTLVRMLEEQLSPMTICVRFSDEFGLPSQAKEAVAFALLAYETWHGLPSNVPSATGAKRPAILGKISHAS